MKLIKKNTFRPLSLRIETSGRWQANFQGFV